MADIRKADLGGKNPRRSGQIYIAEDILPEYVAVNKRVPLTVCGLNAANRKAVAEKLSALYGGGGRAEERRDGKENRK